MVRLSKGKLMLGIVAATLAVATLGAGAAEDDCFGSNPIKALQACDQALAQADRYPRSREVQFRRARAELLLEAGRFEEALNDLVLIAGQNLTSESCHLLRAQVFSGLSRPQDALDAVTMGLELSPKDFDSLLFRSELLLVLGDAEGIGDPGIG